MADRTRPPAQDTPDDDRRGPEDGGPNHGGGRGGPAPDFPAPAVLADPDHPEYQRAWAGLADRLGPWVRRLVATRVARPDDRADVESAVWEKAKRSMSAGVGRHALSAWLCKVAGSVLVDYVRVTVRRVAREVLVDTAVDGRVTSVLSGEPDALARLVAEEQAAARWALVDRLFEGCTPDDRRLLEAWADHVQHEAIAEELGCTTGASRQRLAKLFRTARRRAGLPA